jgi:putative ribosome biogenesis GTPase RsgA
MDVRKKCNQCKHHKTPKCATCRRTIPANAKDRRKLPDKYTPRPK